MSVPVACPSRRSAVVIHGHSRGKRKRTGPGEPHVMGSLPPPLQARGRLPPKYSAEVQQRALTTASQRGRQHTEQAGTTTKRPALPLVRDEEAQSKSSGWGLPRSWSHAELPQQPQPVKENVFRDDASLMEVVDRHARRGPESASPCIVPARGPTVDHRIAVCDLLFDEHGDVRGSCAYIASQVPDAFVRRNRLSCRRITEFKGLCVDLVDDLEPSLTHEVVKYPAGHCPVPLDRHRSSSSPAHAGPEQFARAPAA